MRKSIILMLTAINLTLLLFFPATQVIAQTNFWEQTKGPFGGTVNSLALNSNGDIFVGTAGGGVFRSVGSTTAVEEISSSIPSSFALEQNYPNPFNPSTTIQFALARRSHVMLKLYNVRGMEVTTLIDEALTPGIHKVVFEANGLVSGIYFYRIQAGEFVQTKRLTLLK